MRSRVILCLASLLIAVGAYAGSGKRVPTYRFSYSAKIYPRPYQTELLLEVKNVVDIDETTPGLDSPSIVKLHLTKEVETTVIGTGQKVAIKFPAHDFKSIGGLAAGDRIAAFGMEDGSPVFYRIEKYKGPSDKIEAWFRALK